MGASLRLDGKWRRVRGSACAGRQEERRCTEERALHDSRSQCALYSMVFKLLRQCSWFASMLPWFADLSDVVFCSRGVLLSPHVFSSKDKVEDIILCDLRFQKSGSVLQLSAMTDEPLLVRRNALLVFNQRLDGSDVVRLIDEDGIPCQVQRLHRKRIAPTALRPQHAMHHVT